ncbi:MAG: hypothetical protein ABJD68_15035 [Nakamurella sp.]
MSNDLGYRPASTVDNFGSADGKHSAAQQYSAPSPARDDHRNATPNIADRFADLLAPLSTRRRRGVIARLAVGYYEGWRPSRAEVAELVAQELRRSPR